MEEELKIWFIGSCFRGEDVKYWQFIADEGKGWFLTAEDPTELERRSNVKRIIQVVERDE